MKQCIKCSEEICSEDWHCVKCNYHPDKIDNFDCFSPEFAMQNEYFDDYFFQEFLRAEKHNFWIQNRIKLVKWVFDKYIQKFDSFLEIGCGTGYTLEVLENKYPKKEFWGADIFTKSLEYCRNRLNNTKLAQMNVMEIPFKNHFDVIGAFDVIEHIKEDVEALKEINKALKSRGYIVLTVPHHPFLWSKLDEYSCHERRYRLNELKEKVAEAGFEIQRVSAFMSLVFPLMLISRIFKKKDMTKEESLKEFRINKYINSILNLILSLERILLQKGINFSFGGSLLLVARKSI